MPCKSTIPKTVFWMVLTSGRRRFCPKIPRNFLNQLLRELAERRSWHPKFRYDNPLEQLLRISGQAGILLDQALLALRLVAVVIIYIYYPCAQDRLLFRLVVLLIILIVSGCAFGNDALRPHAIFFCLLVYTEFLRKTVEDILD